MVRSQHRAGRAAAPGGPSIEQERSARPTPSRARSCTRCASGEMAELGEVPFGAYYGSVDATPLFVLLAGLYAERTGDLETLAMLWPAIEAGARLDRRPWRPRRRRLRRIFPRERTRASPTRAGRISFDAIFHADGTLPRARSRSCEVQAYVYAAKSHGWPAAPDARTGWTRRRSSRAEAAALAEQFDAAFWCDELGIYALALDGDKQPCRVRHVERRAVLCSPASRGRTARARRGGADAAATSSPAGASGPSRAARRATIRCPITTARSGRTTTR